MFQDVSQLFVAKVLLDFLPDLDYCPRFLPAVLPEVSNERYSGFISEILEGFSPELLQELLLRFPLQLLTGFLQKFLPAFQYEFLPDVVL